MQFQGNYFRFDPNNSSTLQVRVAGVWFDLKTRCDVSSFSGQEFIEDLDTKVSYA